MGREACESKPHFNQCKTVVEGKSPVVSFLFAPHTHSVVFFCFPHKFFYLFRFPVLSCYSVVCVSVMIVMTIFCCVQSSWVCDHCDKTVFKGNFRSSIARIHLAAETSNGLCANLCTAEDEDAETRRKYFRKLIVTLEAEKKSKSRKRKQRRQRLNELTTSAAASAGSEKKKSKRSKSQPKLKDFLKEQDAAAADLAVAQWALAHDIAPNSMKGPYWKQLNRKLASVAPTYKPMYSAKIFEKMLPVVRKMADKELDEHLQYRPAVGRTLTGDGATKQVPLINFLVHVPGKGVKLLSIHDCSDHLAAGGTKDAMYILLFVYPNPNPNPN